MAFVAFVAFLNSFVSWVFILVGYEGITFEWIFSKLFIPLAWIIGIEWDDCEGVAVLIATKTIINEFVAYERLGRMKAAQEISVSKFIGLAFLLSKRILFVSLKFSYEVQRLPHMPFVDLPIQVHWE